MTREEFRKLQPGDRVRRGNGTISVVGSLAHSVIMTDSVAVFSETYQHYDNWTKLPDDLKAEDFRWECHAACWSHKDTDDRIYLNTATGRFYASATRGTHTTRDEALADLNARRAK